MKINKIISLILSVLMLASVLVSCAGNTEDPTENTTYVSVYVYNKAGKKFLYLDAVRVQPDENSENDWEKTATPFLALQSLCTSKKKDYKISTDIGKNVTVDSVATFNAGEDENGVPFLWYVYVNGKKVEDSRDCELKNYDFVEFKLEENTYRTISITFNATDGAKKLIDEESVTFSGDKTDLTLYNFFNMSAFNSAAKKEGKTELIAEGASVSEMKIELSEDKESIAKISDSAANDEKKWAIYVNDELVTVPLSELVLTDGDSVSFDLKEVEENTDATETEAVEE